MSLLYTTLMYAVYAMYANDETRSNLKIRTKDDKRGLSKQKIQAHKELYLSKLMYDWGKQIRGFY